MIKGAEMPLLFLVKNLDVLRLIKLDFLKNFLYNIFRKKKKSIDNNTIL